MNNRIFRACLVAGLWAIIAAPAAVAQVSKPGDPPRAIRGVAFADFIESNVYVNQLIAYTMGYEKRLGPCRRPEVRRRLPFVRLKNPVRITGVGTPPQWLEVIEIGGCGKTFKRTIFTAYFNNKVQRVAMLMGSSRTGPKLQWEIVRAVLPVARARAKESGCRVGTVRLLKAVREGPAPADSNAPWNETWTTIDCTGNHDYAIALKPDSKGGVIWAAKPK